MGPSLSWYRKSYYLYYMAGASAIYLEQGQDQFFKPGPGEHPFQLNPLGRITDEFMRFVEKHPERGTPYTPVAFLLDPAHGFEMTDYPQWPFEVSQIDRSDRALRELFGVAYYPGLVVEGEPAMADRQPFVAGVFGDIFDVLTAADVQSSRSKVQTLLSSYRAVIVGGRIEWSNEWIKRLDDYVRNGGTVVLNAAQIKKLPEQFLGVRLLNETSLSHNAVCLLPDNEAESLKGQIFPYERVELKGATAIMKVPSGDPIVTVNKIGQGSVVFVATPDLLGKDERMTPFAAHLLAHVFVDAVPVKVVGDVEYLINRTENGWLVTLLNNNGVFKPQQGMAQVDRSAYVTVTITLPQMKSASEWISDTGLTTNGGTARVKIPPGGLAIVEIQ
jgi:Beta-galactosidase trimerisation domain